MPTTVRAARVAVDVMDSAASLTHQETNRAPASSSRTRALWCDYHQSYGKQSTLQCRDRQRAIYRQEAEYPNSRLREAPNPRQYETQPTRRSPRIRPYHRARAARIPSQRPVQSPPHTHDDALDNKQIEWLHDDDASKGVETYSPYVVDSGCHLSFVAHAPAGMHPCAKRVRLPDGTERSIKAQGSASLSTRTGRVLRLPRLSVAPSFRQNLLSVREAAQANPCIVLLGRRRGVLAEKVMVRTRDVVALISLTPDGYTIPLTHETGQARTATQTRITDFFCERKSGRSPPTLRQSAKPQRRTPSRLPCIRAPLAAPARVRNRHHDRATHREVSPPNMPLIPPQQRALARDIYGWHLILNHTHPSTLRQMASLPYDVSLPRTLSQPCPMICSGCAVGNMSKARHAGRM